MGILKFLKNKQPSPALEDFNKAKEKYDNNEFVEALRALSFGFQKDVMYMPLYRLSIKCLQSLDAEEESRHFEAVIHNKNSFEAFNNLGMHFFDEGHLNLALVFLEKAVSIDTSNLETVHDLALAYARRFQIKKALETIEKNPPEKDFWNFWLWCKLRILAEQPKGVKEDLNELIQVLDAEENQEDVHIPRQKVNEVQEMLLRYELVKNPKNHIKDWHFIQYGAAILDFFDDTEDFVAGGRYVASWGSNESIKELAEKLKIYLVALDISIDKVAYLNDRSAKIIGLVISSILKVEATVYNANENNENTLIVAANSRDFNQEELEVIKDGQVLFALNHEWFKEAAISPDIIGVMNQSYVFPWDGGAYKIINHETREMEQTQPDTRAEEAIAKDICNIDTELNLNKEYLHFYVQHKDYLKIGSKSNKQRFNFMIESPVPGSYFG